MAEQRFSKSAQAAPVVLDTNILFASLWGARGPRKLVQEWKQGRLRCAVSPAVLKGDRHILGKVPRGRRLLEELAPVLEDRSRTVFVRPTTVPRVVVEVPSDDHFLACAAASGASAIVSNDRHLRQLGAWRGIRIVRVKEL